MNNEQKGMLAAALAYCIFGFSYLFSKMALNITDPIILLCARFTTTFLALNLLVLTGAFKLNLTLKKLPGPILLGILQPVLYFVLENYGLKYTTTSFTGMISSTNPIFTALLGALILRERPNFKQWLCIVVSIAGVLLVSLRSTGGANTPLGCICLIAAYFSGSFYSLLVRRMSKDYSPFELTYIMFTVGFVFFTGWAFIQNGSQTLPILTGALSQRSFVIAVLYLGVLSSVIAYLLTNYALARLPVARATIFTNITTIVSVLSGVVIMHDEFPPVNLLAFALILIGVIGVNRFSEKEAA